MLSFYIWITVWQPLLNFVKKKCYLKTLRGRALDNRQLRKYNNHYLSIIKWRNDAFISLHVCQLPCLVWSNTDLYWKPVHTQKIMQRMINTCYKYDRFHTRVQIHKCNRKREYKWENKTTWGTPKMRFVLRDVSVFQRCPCMWRPRRCL